MEKRRYIQMKALEAAIDEMLAQGEIYQEIEEPSELQGDQPLRCFLKKRGRKERKLVVGIP